MASGAPVRPIRDEGSRVSPSWRAASGVPWGSAAPNCRRMLGKRSRWPREARGQGFTSSAPRGCGQPADGSPARPTGPFTDETWTAANPAITCPTPRRGTSLETLARVGGSRWRIETEFETEKSDVGMDEYETRTWAGWHHHIALSLLAGAFLLSLQQAWGEKDAPDNPSPGLPGGA